MIIKSDWHIHSQYSYDAKNSLDEIAKVAIDTNLKSVGITDHANFNDKKFIYDVTASAQNVKKAQEKYPFMVLGVELTPIEKPEFDYIARSGTREGYVAPTQSTPFEIELALTKEELKNLGMRYAIGASHWRVDVPHKQRLTPSLKEDINEWFRQQLWLACDSRVTILGHPWYHGQGIWYKDFSLIPHSMNDELISALKQNGKYIECNSHFFRTANATEKFRCQYAEFLREAFEKGISVTYGSDSHASYTDVRETVEKYLIPVGFKDGDICEIAKKDLW